MADSDTDPAKPGSAAEATEAGDHQPGRVAPAAEPAAAPPTGDPAAESSTPDDEGETAAPRLRDRKSAASEPTPSVAAGPENGREPMSERGATVSAAPAGAEPRKSGRVPATFALLLSIVAISAAGYVFYRDWLDDPNAPFEAIRAYRDEQADSQSALTAEVAALRGELARLDGELVAQRQALAAARTAAEALAADAVHASPPTPESWKLAEVEYLLTIANRHLLMQRDAAAAGKALALADQVLADLDDFRLHEVRALLADEKLALRTFEYPDTQALFLRLEAVKGLLDKLPLRLPEYSAEDADVPSGTDAQTSMVDALLHRLHGLVRFRRHDGEAIRPLLAPAEAEYLEQHLRLALERAQLAVLRRDQGLYETSLRAARNWLHRFVEPARTAVVETRGELDELLGMDLTGRPPDISRSLERLRELRRDRNTATP